MLLISSGGDNDFNFDVATTSTVSFHPILPKLNADFCTNILPMWNACGGRCMYGRQHPSFLPLVPPKEGAETAFKWHLQARPAAVSPFTDLSSGKIQSSTYEGVQSDKETYTGIRYRMVRRLRDSHLLASSYHRGMFHAT